MGKGGSVQAVTMLARRTLLNSGASWPAPGKARVRVLDHQRSCIDGRRPNRIAGFGAHLTIHVESRMRGNVHVRFGGRGQENLRQKGRKASRPRPNASSNALLAAARKLTSRARSILALTGLVGWRGKAIKGSYAATDRCWG